MVVALRQFVDADNRKALVTVNLLDQHRVVQKWLVPIFTQRRTQVLR